MYNYYDPTIPDSYMLLSLYLPVTNFKPNNTDCELAMNLPTFFRENSKIFN